MTITDSRAASATSLRLRSVAEEAFTDRLLPALRAQLPVIVDRILVTITSSVAYGTADERSDLDMFVIFPHHEDYVQYAAVLEGIVTGLDLERHYGDACDKGVRFELESLRRSDLAALYHHPTSQVAWQRQTEWLLCWLLDSIPIYDPLGVHARLSRVAGQWPATVRTARIDRARARIACWSAVAITELDRAGTTFLAARAAARVADAGFDLAYLLGDRYAPHPKWREHQARALLTANQAVQVLDGLDALTQALAGDRPQKRILKGALSAFASEFGLRGSRAEEWSAVLEARAWRFDTPGRHCWVLKDAMPHRSSLEAAVAATSAGEVVYLCEDLGADRLASPGYSYDQAMRISDSLRWLTTQDPDVLRTPHFKLAESRSIELKRWRYLNFIIWRKLRVIAKAEHRMQPFTQYWYQLQVVDHLCEGYSRLAGEFAPPAQCLDANTAQVLPADLRDVLVKPGELAHLLYSGERFLRWGWSQFEQLQESLVSAGLLDQSDHVDPLASQWDIEYWKYENLLT